MYMYMHVSEYHNERTSCVYTYLGESLGEVLKHITAVQTTVIIDVQFSCEVWQIAQLNVSVGGERVQYDFVQLYMFLLKFHGLASQVSWTCFSITCNNESNYLNNAL